jgi:Lon protease-like protein
VALAGDRLIAMALLKQPRAEEFHETVCVGHVIHTEPLEQGRSHIALLGLCAGRAEEITGKSEEPYRTVRVDLLDDRLDTGHAARGKLEKVLPHTVPGAGTIESLEEQLEKFIAPERIAAALINTCALSAPILPLHKQELLEERSMARRLDLLIEFIERPWQWN